MERSGDYLKCAALEKPFEAPLGQVKRVKEKAPLASEPGPFKKDY